MFPRLFAAGAESGRKPRRTRVLILGVNGFIGNHLSERLLRDDRYEIYGLDIQPDNIAETRERMAALAAAFVESRGFTPNPRFVADVREIVSRNYRAGDFLNGGVALFGAEPEGRPQGQLQFDW